MRIALLFLSLIVQSLLCIHTRIFLHIPDSHTIVKGLVEPTIKDNISFLPYYSLILKSPSGIHTSSFPQLLYSVCSQCTAPFIPNTTKSLTQNIGPPKCRSIPSLMLYNIPSRFPSLLFPLSPSYCTGPITNEKNVRQDIHPLPRRLRALRLLQTLSQGRDGRGMYTAPRPTEIRECWLSRA